MSTQIQVSPVTEFADVAASQTRKLLVMANLKAPEMQLQEGKERAPISVSAVIDRSGSMQGSKLHLTKATLRFVITNLNDRDEFGIISYASDVKQALPLQKMDAAGRRRALQAVEGISADGCTNLSGGLFMGIDQLKGITLPEDNGRPPRSVFQRMPFRRPLANATPQISFKVGNENTNATTQTWKLFVQLADGVTGDVGQYIQSVQFDLATSSSAMQAVTVAMAPFELSRTETCQEVEVHIKLTATYGGTVHTFRHTPNFLSPITFCTVQIPDITQAPPVITTTPPSQPATHPLPLIPGQRNDVSAVWLFTDGLANEGIQDSAELVRLTAERLQGMTPACSVFTFGFGEDHNAQMLKDVADAGKGMYYFVQNEAAIVESFADCLGGLMSVVARNLKLIAVPVAGVVACRMFTKYDHHVSPDEAWVVIPDIYCEEERDVILEIEVSPVDPPNATPSPIVHWRLDYHNVLTDEDDTVAACCLLGRPAEATEGPSHPLLDQQHNRVRCTDAIQAARRMADIGHIVDAQKQLDDAIVAIKESVSGKENFCVGLVEDLQDCRAQIESIASYRANGSKTMMSAESCHTWQRSCGMKAKYSNSAKTSMAQNFQSLM